MSNFFPSKLRRIKSVETTRIFRPEKSHQKAYSGNNVDFPTIEIKSKWKQRGFFN